MPWTNFVNSMNDVSVSDSLRVPKNYTLIFTPAHDCPSFSLGCQIEGAVNADTQDARCTENLF